MTEADDSRLLRDCAKRQSDAAFTELVRRHVNLVYSVALRQTGNPHDAEEITQAVFLLLARKAGSLRAGTILPGWLYQAARLTAANFLRAERRRAFREQETCMQSLGDAPVQESWGRIAPLLEEVMGKLGDKDRNAIVLRFFEDKSLREVGLAMGGSEDAAKMRVNRTLEKLRRYFGKRGVAVAATALAGALSANAVVAAPPGLAVPLSGAAVGGAVPGSILALVEETLRLIAWPRVKIAAVVVAAVLVVGGTAAMMLLVRQPAAPVLAPAAPGPRITHSALRSPEPREPFTPGVHMTLEVPPGAVMVQPDGKIVLGSTLSGFFVDEQSEVLGAYRRGAIRFQADGVLDRTFYSEVDDLGACDSMRAHLALSPDGRLLVTGLFKAVEGKPRFNYALLRADGSLDESFEPWRGMTNNTQRTFINGATFPAVFLSDGAVAVGSDAREGRRVPYPMTVYHLDASGRMIPRVAASSPFPQPSGLILTLGEVGFWARKPVDWEQELPLARKKFYFPAGEEPPVADLVFDQWDGPPTAQQARIVLKALFEEVPIELCRYAVRLPDGGVVLAVRTKAVNGSRMASGRFMRFDSDWHPDPAFTNSYEADWGSCVTLKLQPDGKLLVAGMVGKLDGETFPGLVRLEKDGSIDHSFHCETSERSGGDAVLAGLRQRIIGLALQEDGRMVISGYFTQVNGVECPHVARLNPDGSLDETFRTPFTSWEGLKAWRQLRVQRLAEAEEPSVASLAARPVAGQVESPAETVFILSLKLDEGGAVIQILGRPSGVYILQSAASLNSTAWSNLVTNKANAQGTGSFRDERAMKQPMCFYRIARP